MDAKDTMWLATVKTVCVANHLHNFEGLAFLFSAQCWLLAVCGTCTHHFKLIEISLLHNEFRSIVYIRGRLNYHHINAKKIHSTFVTVPRIDRIESRIKDIEIHRDLWQRLAVGEG